MIIGLVGKPSAGKSTFFKAVTLADVEIANYPFTTIDKNEGVGFVSVDCPDKFFNVQCNPRFGFCKNHQRFVPVQIIDVAGLVPGAHKGKGRGNQFLDDLRQADVLIHVVDISGSTNAVGEDVEKGSWNPADDIKFLEDEIDLWFYGIIERNWKRLFRQIQQEKTEGYRMIAKQLSGLGVTEDIAKEVVNGYDKEFKNWDNSDLLTVVREIRRKVKPILIAGNKIDYDSGNFEKIDSEDIIPCSAESELALREAEKKGLIDYVPGSNSFEIKGNLSAEQEKGLKMIKELVLDKYGSTGVLQVLNKAVFDVLGYIAIFPGGVNKLEDSEGRVLPDCFLMPKGSTALDFAYRLHTDFGDKFIRAIDVKTKRTVGKEHVLKNGDVIEIVSGK